MSGWEEKDNARGERRAWKVRAWKRSEERWDASTRKVDIYYIRATFVAFADDARSKNDRCATERW